MPYEFTSLALINFANFKCNLGCKIVLKMNKAEAKPNKRIPVMNPKPQSNVILVIIIPTDLQTTKPFLFTKQLNASIQYQVP